MQAALLLNAKSWNGRRFKLRESLLNRWSELHELRRSNDNVSAVPAGRAEAVTLCSSLGVCVCDQESQAYQAYRFHVNFIALLKPHVVKPRKKAGESERKPVPLGRVLLEGTWLVCRLTPSHAHQREQLSDSDEDSSGPMSAWGRAAAARLAARRHAALPSDIFFLVSYVNFSTYRFALLPVECEDVAEPGSWQESRQLRMRVPAGLNVQTSIDFFRSRLDLDLEWTATWYRIVEQGDVHEGSFLDEDDMTPDRFLVEPTAAVGSWRPWKGKAAESLERKRQSTQRNSGRGQSGQTGPRKRPTETRTRTQGPRSKRLRNAKDSGESAAFCVEDEMHIERDDDGDEAAPADDGDCDDSCDNSDNEPAAGEVSYDLDPAMYIYSDNEADLADTELSDPENPENEKETVPAGWDPADWKAVWVNLGVSSCANIILFCCLLLSR